MGTELALIEPIHLPANPARLPLLPAWLQQRSDAVESVLQADQEGKHRQVPTLPPSLILDSVERQMVEHHIVDLNTMISLEQTIVLREQTLTNDQAHAVMIASLLIKGKGIKLDKASADALTEDFLDAIEDLPAWTVREALRKWNRAESIQLDPKKPHDFTWRPEPPTLRKLAYWELWMIKSRIRRLEMILAAVPLIEFSDEHRQGMLDRLAVVIRDAANPAMSQNPTSFDAEKRDAAQSSHEAAE